MSDLLMIRKMADVFGSLQSVKNNPENVGNGQFSASGNRENIFLGDFRSQEGPKTFSGTISYCRKILKIFLEDFPVPERSLKFSRSDFPWRKIVQNSSHHSSLERLTLFPS